MVFLFLGEAVSGVLGFATAILLARRLTDQGFGLLAFAQSIIAYFAILIDLGLAVFGAREIARKPEEAQKISVNIFAIRLSIAVVIMVMFNLTMALLPQPPEIKLLLFAGSLALLTQAMNPEFLFQGLEKMGGIALWRILIHVLYLLPILFFVHSRSQLVWTLFFRFAAECLAVLITFMLVRRLLRGAWRRWLDPSLWKSYIKESVVIALAVVVVRIYYSFDTFMLGLMDKPEAVGWYNAALKINQLLIAAASIIQVSFAPLIARESADPHRLDLTVTRFGVILSVVGALACGTIILLHEFIVTTLYGAGYENAGAPLIVLSVSTLVNYMATTFTAALIFGGRQKEYLKIVVIAAVVNLLLNILLIPKFSYMGAAWANLCFGLVLLGWSVPVYFKLGRSFVVLRHLFFISLLFAVLMIFLPWLILRPFVQALIFIIGFSSIMMVLYKNQIVEVYRNVRHSV
jgi:O-antigen/teichoic acid export membrane protein